MSEAQTPFLFSAMDAPLHPSAKPRRRPKAKAPAKPRKAAVPEAPIAYLTVNEVAQRYRVSRPTIWRWVQTEPDFPAPMKLGGGATRWLLQELLDHEKARAAARGRGAKS